MINAFCSEYSIRFFRNLFWYIYCYFFQNDSEEYQKQFMEYNKYIYREMKNNYIFYLSSFPKLPDNVCSVFHIIQAESVITDLFYLFRKARHLLTRQFRVIVHKIVLLILLLDI